MEKHDLYKKLAALFPEFEKHWDIEDINREADGIYTAHGLMSSFFFFYLENYSNLDESAIRNTANLFENIVESDPSDESDVSNAICTSFLEMLDKNKEGKVIEKYLGKECKAFLDAMRGVD